MNADQNRAKSIYLNAAEIASPTERESYLGVECKDDTALRQEVEDLLKHHEPAAAFLESPAAVLVVTGDVVASSRDETHTTVPREAGTIIAGRFKLLEPIGEGGMGTVWMAQQSEPIKRLVAIKLIKPGMDSRQVLARFDAERQALALMDHPNIAKVFDAGTTSETEPCISEPRTSVSGPHQPLTNVRGSVRPFFVMELVKGVPITKYCDEHHLTPRQRLELFIPVCQAIQHAHQKGIIHRDIKPSNVLVAMYDDRPVPKVIDFGVAKATGQQLTEETLHTNFGAIVGTIEYMSPEQASFNQLDVDTRSDIYSLGVLLYELLAGSTPFTKKDLEKAGMMEMLRLIREQEPSKPSTKLSSSDALPSLSANRGTEPSRLAKLVRGELDWIVMKALEKDRSRRYETANGFAMDVQRYLADEPVQACPPSAGYRLRKFMRRNRRALTTAAVLGVAVLVAVGGAAWSIGWANRDRAARQARAANELELSLDRVDLFLGQGKRAEALAALERAELLAAEASREPDRDGRLAALRERLDAEGRDQEFLARFEDIRLRVESQADVEVNRFSTKGAFTEIREALRRYGIEIGVMEPAVVARHIQGRPEPVRRNIVAALDECARYTPHGDSQTLQWLRAALDAAEDDPWRLQVRKVSAANDSEALEQFLREVDVRKQPPSFLIMAMHGLPERMQPARLEFLRRVQRAYPADLWANYSLAVDLLEKHGQAAEAVRYFMVAQALRPDHPVMYCSRGNALREAGELDAAIADYRQSLALAPRYVVAHNNLGETLRRKGQTDDAIAACREAIRLKADHAEAHCSLGLALRDKGQLDAAIAACREAIRLKNNYAGAHHCLGLALRGQGKFGEAIAAYREAIEHDPKLTNAHLNLGALLCDHLKDYENAAACFRKAIELAPKNAEAHANLGNALSGQRKLDAAIAEYREAIRIGVKSDPARVHYQLGFALAATGQTDDAIAAYRKAIGLDPKHMDARLRLGTLLCDDLRDYENAADCFRKAIELDPTNAKAHCNLGTALRGQRKLDAAITEFREAIRLNKDLPEAHNGLGNALGDKGEPDNAITEYREAIRLDKDFADAHYNLGGAHYRKSQLDAAIAEYREAIRIGLKYDQALAHNGLGSALLNKGQLDEAITEFRKAIRLKNDLPEAHYSLGLALDRKGQLDAAITAYREAIRLKADYAEPHVNIGNALASKDQLEAAIAEYREAIRIKRDLPEAHGALGVALATKGQTDDAITEYREAIRLNKDDAGPHYNLGMALVSKGQLEAAIAEYREAIRLKADYAEAHCNLGHALRRQGEFPKAVEALRRGHEIGSKDPRWPYPSAQWVRQCEREVELDRQLPGFLAGKTTPASPDERIALAELCVVKQLNRAAVGFFAEGFVGEPKLADDLDASHRYNAACAAALAGCGQGKDVGTLDDKDRARLRRQALDWLRANLGAWGRLLEKDPDKARSAARVTKTLQHWLVDSDFAGVRGPEALAKLPEAERHPWQQLWGDVADTLARAQGNTTPEKKSHAK